MQRVTLKDGSVRDFSDDEVIMIGTSSRETPAPGYTRTREYPPQYCRATPLRIGVLVVGHYIQLDTGFLRVTKIERLPGSP